MNRVRDSLIGLMIALIFVVTGLAINHFRGKPVVNSPITVATPVETINVPEEFESKSSEIIAALAKSLGREVKSSDQSADWTFTPEKHDNSEPVRWNIAGVPAKLVDSQIVAEDSAPNLYLTGGKLGERIAAAEAVSRVIASGSNRWTLGGLGDIIPGRTVYTVTRGKQDYSYPFRAIADITKAYDLTLADLEITVADGIAYPEGTSMTFGAPASTLDGLKLAGIDAVSVANNHSANQGVSFFGKMLDTLKSAEMPYFGGGKTAAEAKTPYFVTVKGVKIALLGYSSIVGSTAAGANSPGMNYLSMAPWGKLNQTQVDAMAADVTAAKTQADLVFVYYHWGTEYTHDANTDQRAVAHAAIDAGADLILGTHPHWVQGIEWYKDKLITYSLGNFVFDQDWSVPTQQGVMLDATFDGAKLIAAKLRPYRINPSYQPVLASDAEGSQILADIFAHSWWP